MSKNLTTPLLLGGATALLLLKRKTVGAAVTSIIDDLAQLAAVPRAVATYVPMLRAAGERYGVPSSLLAGILWRESNAGTTLKPPGPTGTGDFVPRKPRSRYFSFADPLTGLPPDGLGWGRGLMQVDYGVHNAWVMANDWGNAAVNIDKAASILADFVAYFRHAPGGPVAIEAWRLPTWRALKPNLATMNPDPRPLSGVALYEAALAAYNAGASGVLQALAAGLPASTPTTGGEYANWILSRVTSWS